MKSRTKWALRLSLVGLGLGIGLALVMPVERAYLDKEQHAARPVFEPYGIKYAYSLPLEPGVVRGWVKGMAPPPKRTGIKRVVALGDSVTFGLGVRREHAWPAVLESELDGVEVFNLGMCGWDIEQSVSLAVGVLEGWAPDLVIFGNFSNDILPTFLMWGAHETHPIFVGSSVPDGVGTFSATMDLALASRWAIYRAWMGARMARAMSAGLSPKPTPQWYPDQLARLKAWSARAEIPVLVLTIPDHTQAQPEHCSEAVTAHDCEIQAEGYQRIVDAVLVSGLPWVDGQRLYAATGRSHFMLRPGEHPGPGAWPNDAEHPTAAGHTALAKGLVAEAERLLVR